MGSVSLEAAKLRTKAGTATAKTLPPIPKIAAAWTAEKALIERQTMNQEAVASKE